MFRLFLALLVPLALLLGSCSTGGGGGNTETANLTVIAEGGDGASITVLSYNSDGSKKRDEVSGTIQEQEFNTPVKMDKKGGYLVINITKDGFADWSKKVNFEEPKDITVNANLTPIQSQSVIPVGEGSITVSSTGERVIKIALIKRNDGRKIIATGDKIRTANGIPEYTMEIPVKRIPPETKALKVGLSSFDPEKDADKFPGDYVDKDGKRLISLGFNFVDIRDATTNEPIFSNKEISTTQSTNVRITRWIGENVCDNLQGDFCTGDTNDPQICSTLTQDEINGYNVPFYRYDENSGVWELLGVGTIDLNNDGQIDAADAIDPSSFDAVQICQNNNGFNTIIVITNPDFRYCNLDYPVVNPPTELCIIKTFKDPNGQPFTNIWAWLEDDDENQSFLYTTGGFPDQNGTVKLTTWNIEGDEDRTANLVYSYSITVNNQTILVTKREQVTLGTSKNCPTLDNTINPEEKPCLVKGDIKFADDTSAANIPVYITDEYSFFKTTSTDEDGHFEAVVVCETDLTVYSLNFEDVAEFNANGSVNDDEASDEAQPETPQYRYIVTLQNITLEKPEYNLYVFKDGDGTVTSTPDGINCGDDCEEDYEAGTTVTLTATPAEGYHVDSWFGCDSVSPDKSTCKVNMNTYRAVTVKFVSNVQRTLSITVNGNGYVMSTPSGIHCNNSGQGMCQAQFNDGEQVTLTATPLDNYTFSGWGGDCSSCGSNTTCSITMDSDKNCTADFVQAQAPSVDMTGVWEGSYHGNDGSSGQICVELQQTGNNLSGNLYIQGQGLVGSVTGTINGNNIEFGIAAGVQYSGEVSNDGNSANGTYDEDRDGNDDGTWSVTRSNKESCGWLSEEIIGDMSEYLPAPLGLLITEVPTITVNNNGNEENDWYAVIVEYSDQTQSTSIQYMVLEKSDRSAIFHILGSLAAYYDAQQALIYGYNSSTNIQFMSNQSYSTTPMYESPCSNGTKYRVYKGTATISLNQITLTDVTNSTSRTFEIPQQDNITVYKVEYTSCQ